MRHRVVAALLLFITGCVSPLNTPSGCPEVFISGASAQTVSNHLVSAWIGAGYSVEQQTASSILLTRDADDIATQLFFGSEFNTTPQCQLRLNIVPVGMSTKVVANYAVVTNPGSAFAKRTDFSKSSKAAHQIQESLDRLRTQLEFRDISAERLQAIEAAKN